MDINRGVIVVKAREPYVEWANTQDDSGVQMSLEEAREDSSAYLVPCWDNDTGLEAILKRFAKEIFESELAGWTTDTSTWPKQRGFATLRKWFDVEAHSVAYEIGDGWIQVEEA